MSPQSVGDEARSAPESARSRISRVAKTFFATRGYENTSTSAIARAAGTSESQLMKHFGSKAGLLEAIFIEGWKGITEEARQAIQNLPTPVHKLQAIAACALSALEKDPELKVLFLLEGRRVRREGSMVALTEGYLEFVALVDEVFAVMASKQMLNPRLSPHAMRSSLMGMLESMLRDRYLASRLRFPADFGPHEIAEALGIALQAYIVAPPPETG